MGFASKVRRFISSTATDGASWLARKAKENGSGALTYMGEGLIGLFTEPGEWMRRNPLGAGLLVMGTSFLILPVVAVTSFASSLYKDYQSSQQKIGDGKDAPKDPTDPTQDGNKVGAGVSNANANENANENRQQQAAAAKLSSTASQKKADVESAQFKEIVKLYNETVKSTGVKKPVVDKASKTIKLSFANADERKAFLAGLKDNGIKFTARDPVSGEALPSNPSPAQMAAKGKNGSENPAANPAASAAEKVEGLEGGAKGPMSDSKEPEPRACP